MADDKAIEIQCPRCETTKKIDVPKYLLDKKKFGTLKIQIHSGVCCEHEFIAFIDRKGKVRGYENIDMSVDLSQYAERSIGEKVYIRDLLQLYGDYAVSSMLHAIILNINIVILKKEDEKNRTSEMNTIFNSILPDNLQSPLIVSYLDVEDYKKTKLDEALVLSPHGLLANTPWQDIALNYEKNLIRKALDILDDESQAIIIQQELEYLFKKTDFIAEYIKTIDQIYEDDLKEVVQKEFSEQNISDNHLLLMKQVLQFRNNADINKIKIRSFSKLKEGLW